MSHINNLNILRYTLKKKWWDMTFISRIKKEEYREIKPYWISRLIDFSDVPIEQKQDLSVIASDIIFDINNGHDPNEVIKAYHCKFKPFTHAEVKLGYARDAPTGLIEIKGIRIGTAVPEWSDNWQGNVFVIEWGNVIEVKKLKQQ